MILPIRTYGDPVLRRVARPVTDFDDELRRLADDLVETMHAANGVGLAAPQVGVPRRVFVALELADPDARDGGQVAAEDEEGDGATAAALPEGDGAEAGAPDVDRDDGGDAAGGPQDVVHVMVNPEIVLREGQQFGPDGCLSLPGLSVEEMERDLRIRVRYQALDGAPGEVEAEGHFAHVLQHEFDHLEGVLFFDRLPGRERQRFLEEHRAELADMQRRAKAFLKDLRRRDAAPGT